MSHSLPMLQVALDNQSMDDAYKTTRLIASEVDIIEVGTILCVAEGVRAVRDLKALYPEKIVLADAKIADAGKILSRMCFEANADWVTVICCADINTTKGALEVAKEFNGDVQIELTGHWTREPAKEWHDAGLQQVVYHSSRDAQAAGVAWPARVVRVRDTSHPLASREVTLGDLHRWPLALPGHHTTVRQLFDLSCQMNDCVVEPVLTCDYFATLYHFLLHTPQAVTICSAFTLLFERESQSLVLRSLGVDQLSQRTLQLQTVSGRQRNAALTLFLEFLQQRLTEMDQQVRMG